MPVFSEMGGTQNKLEPSPLELQFSGSFSHQTLSLAPNHVSVSKPTFSSLVTCDYKWGGTPKSSFAFILVIFSNKPSILGVPMA